MSIHSVSTVFSSVIDFFRQSRQSSDFAGLDAAEAARIAHDLNLSVDDLTALVQQSPDEAALMDRMMALHGIHRATLQRTMPELVRDMAATCAHCACKGECKSDLDAGVSTAITDTYCPNADTMRVVAAF